MRTFVLAKIQEFSRLNYQPNVNFGRISESIQKGMEERSGYANVMFKCLLEEIQEFESGLKPDEEIGAYLAWLAAQAIAAYVEEQSWQIQQIVEAVALADSEQAVWVEGTEVGAWLTSWVTENEKPMPCEYRTPRAEPTFPKGKGKRAASRKKTLVFADIRMTLCLCEYPN